MYLVFFALKIRFLVFFLEISSTGMVTEKLVCVSDVLSLNVEGHQIDGSKEKEDDWEANQAYQVQFGHHLSVNSQVCSIPTMLSFQTFDCTGVIFILRSLKSH